jgi:hypothetical protein
MKPLEIALSEAGGGEGNLSNVNISLFGIFTMNPLCTTIIYPDLKNQNIKDGCSTDGPRKILDKGSTYFLIVIHTGIAEV